MIADLLKNLNAIGRENSVSRKTLTGLTGLSDRKLRSTIENERRAGELICSHMEPGGGYYLPETAVELRAYVSEQRSRIQSQILALTPLERALNGGM